MRGASIVLVLVACSTPPSSSSDAGMESSAMMPMAPGIGCLGILDCAKACSTDACGDDCVAKGTSSARTAVTALATCFQNHSCMDSACLTANCKMELQACVADSTLVSNGQPSGAAPMGNVPAQMVGTWSAISGYTSDTEQSWTFNADGSTTYANARAGGYAGCNNTNVTNRSGTVTGDDKSFTFYVTKDTFTTTVCGLTPTTSTHENKSYAYTYSFLMDGKLQIVDSACADMYTGYPGSIGLYCTANFTKQ